MTKPTDIPRPLANTHTNRVPRPSIYPAARVTDIEDEDEFIELTGGSPDVSNRRTSIPVDRERKQETRELLAENFPYHLRQTIANPTHASFDQVRKVQHDKQRIKELIRRVGLRDDSVFLNKIGASDGQKSNAPEAIEESAGTKERSIFTKESSQEKHFAADLPKRLSQSVLKMVADYLYPSQLSKLAALSKEWRIKIHGLPVWRELCEEAGLVLTSDQIKDRGYKQPDYFRIALESSNVICEQCFRLTRSSGAFRALPVTIAESPVPTKVLMCRDCRVEYYLDLPEPVPDTVAPYTKGGIAVTPRMTKGEAMKAYLLTGSDVMSLPYEMGRNPYFSRQAPMYLFEEQHILRLARQVHGGDIGIAAAHSSLETVGRKAPDPQRDVIRHRRNLLRSLLHDKGLHLPEHAAICHIYTEHGVGDPVKIVEELQAVDWFHRFTNYDPSLDKAHLNQVKCRPHISHNRVAESEALDKSSQDEIMTEKEEEEDDHHKMAAVDGWLQDRLDQGLYDSYKRDPDGPEKPPKSIWPLLDQIDMGHKLLLFAAKRVFCSILKCVRQKGELDSVKLSKNEIRAMVDTPDQVSGVFSTSNTRKRKRSVEEGMGRDSSKDPAPRLSALLEHELGTNWDLKVLDKAMTMITACLS
ncbi:hypothetical protein EMPS_00069 [Entomortierella parvispora]|uniref:F-box domain-containing protein n=1 Tax=Entomortierella parvispora TaxID=205924 RepID=A0A9P3H115_9FUNG|nr:hypothetical protein EMPS_00069 [Entomortierella parvispora]